MTNRHIDQDGVVTGQVSIGCPTVLVRFKKQKEPQSVRVVSDHNKRARFFYQEGHAHASEGGEFIAQKNVKLWGPDTPEEVANAARERMTQQGVKKLRKDAVRAVEVLLSLSTSHGIDDIAFFKASMDWFAERFGGIENLLAADVHHDEANDHVHMLFLPLLDGRMVGSQMVGGKGKLKGCKLSFDEEVCRRFGVKVLMADCLNGPEKARASRAIHDHLAAVCDPVSQSIVWGAICSSIESRPEPYLHSLGFDVSMFRKAKRLKTMAQTFTSPGKGATRRDQYDGSMR